MLQLAARWQLDADEVESSFAVNAIKEGKLDAQCDSEVAELGFAVVVGRCHIAPCHMPQIVARASGVPNGVASAVAIAVAVASNDATPPVWQHYHYQVRLLFADIQVCK